MATDDIIPGSTMTREEMAASLHKRMEKLEQGHSELKTAVEEVAKDTSEIVAIFKSMKIAFYIFIAAAKFLKWIATLGGACLVIWGIWYAVTHVGPEPPKGIPHFSD